MRLDVLGSRGSMPAVGSDFVRYGGDTSSVAVSPGDGPPTLLLDGGTGLRNLAALTPSFRGVLLLTHLHWDHTHGIPFSSAVDHPDAEVHVFVPSQSGDCHDVLARAIGPPHFPVVPSELRGKWTFEWLDEGTYEIAGFTVLARQIAHKGGRTFGYRITGSSGSVAYLPDHRIGDNDRDAVEALVRGVDLLLHDAQYLAEEWPNVSHYGHSTVDQAVGLAEELDVAELMLFHHDPSRSDDALDDILSSIHNGAVFAAATGDTVVFGDESRRIRASSSGSP